EPEQRRRGQPRSTPRRHSRPAWSARRGGAETDQRSPLVLPNPRTQPADTQTPASSRPEGTKPRRRRQHGPTSTPSPAPERHRGRCEAGRRAPEATEEKASGLVVPANGALTQKARPNPRSERRRGDDDEKPARSRSRSSRSASLVEVAEERRKLDRGDNL